MPFTLSHPAAVIPLARGRMVPSALVAGSMAPDLPYFFGMGDLRAVTHEPLGILTLDPLLGIALLAAFHLLWKRPLVALAPDPVRRRMTGPARGFRRSMFVWVLPSIMVGIATHVFWDAFTHLNHSFSGSLPWLVTTSIAGMELYRWLQYGSGVLGLAVVLWWMARWMRRAPAAPDPLAGLPRRAAAGAVAALLACAAAGGTIGAVVLFNQPDLPRTAHMTLAGAVIGTICGGVLALSAYGAAFALLDRRRPASGPPASPPSSPAEKTPAPTAPAPVPAGEPGPATPGPDTSG